MNREIKFRAWDKFNECYWYGVNPASLSDFFAKMQLLIDGGNEIVFEQFTGLKDKNGKEIYEGDVVKWGHLPSSLEDEIRKAEVKINPDIQFDCQNIRYPHVFHYASFAYGAGQVEVIGNIYENPELVKR